jgi:hypothetical protein
MVNFVMFRLIRMCVTIFALVSIVFFATRFTGDAIDYLMPEGLDPAGRSAMMAYWGLDRPLLDQYILFWRSIFEGHFGLSLLERRPVEIIFGERVTRSLLLLVGTLLVTIMIGVPAGIAAAVWRKSTLGSVILAVAFIGYSIPNFILAIMLILIFSFTLHWLPSSGATSLAHFIMPTMAGAMVSGLDAGAVTPKNRRQGTFVIDTIGIDVAQIVGMQNRRHHKGHRQRHPHCRPRHRGNLQEIRAEDHHRPHKNKDGDFAQTHIRQGKWPRRIKITDRHTTQP